MHEWWSPEATRVGRVLLPGGRRPLRLEYFEGYEIEEFEVPGLASEQVNEARRRRSYRVGPFLVEEFGVAEPQRRAIRVVMAVGEVLDQGLGGGSSGA